MSVEFIEEIHDGVGIERGGADDDMFFILCTVTAVRAPLFLTLHPCESQLLELQKARRKRNLGIILASGGIEHLLKKSSLDYSKRKKLLLLIY